MPERDYERQRDEYQRTLAEYRSRRETTETGVAWLQAQIKEDACWDRAIPPDDRLVSAVTVGELSIDDARWVRQAAELLKADRQMKLAILDRCTGWASFELAAQMLGVSLAATGTGPATGKRTGSQLAGLSPIP